MATVTRPLVGITMGDPAGIGPEVVAKALDECSLWDVARPLVIGDCAVLVRAVELVEARVKVRKVSWPQREAPAQGVVEVIDLDNVNVERLRVGEVQGTAGRAAFEYIKRATEMALAGAIDAVATAPVNKEALRAGNVPYIDHTEMLADLTNCHELLTMFAVQKLKIFFATRHLSVARACQDVTEQSVFTTLVRADAALRRFGWYDARLAVAALNPHAGDGGLFGDEETTRLRPAVERASRDGINAHGPIPADSVFHRCLQGDFDAVISLYHDQGHIAAKTLDFERTVSITTGLPFVRTSVDHGTAFDIAGSGIASGVSMGEAIRAAAEYTLRVRGVEASTGSI